MFTRQHYKAIAEIIKENAVCVPIGESDHEKTDARVMGQKMAGNWISQALADYFAADNPRFDRTKFIEACGL